MRYPVVLFDLNGTLVDTFDDLADALNDQLQAMARPSLTVDQVRQWAGENLRTILKSALAATGAVATDLEINDILHGFRARYEERLGARARLYPHVAEALTQLATQGVRMAVLTNKPQAPSLRLLKHVGIDSHFRFLLTCDGDVPKKPDPTGLLALMDQLGGDASGTLLVGSSRIDLETARNGGVRVALVDHDHSHVVHGMGADYVLDGFERLERLVLAGSQGTNPSLRAME
jgi:phosphoglycolate phosphatase